MPRVNVEGFPPINFPDDMSPAEIKHIIETEILPQGSAMKQKGRDYAKTESTGPAVLNAIKGATFGWGDELAGVVAGISGLAEGLPYKTGYEAGRDYSRGAVEQHQKDYPLAAGIGNVSGAVGTAPLIPLKAVQGGLATRALMGGGAGAGFGAVQGAGDSENIDRMMEDAAGGGISGAFIGGGLPVVGSVMGTAANAIGTRIPNGVKETWNSGVKMLPPAIQSIADKLGLRFDGTMSEQLAFREIGKEMARQGKTGSQIAKELTALGPEARTADVVGLETLDTMANLPGKTRDAAKSAVRSRQISRPERLDAVADDMAGTSTKGKDIITDLTTTQEVNAGPLYAKVDEMSIPLTEKLMELTNRPAMKGAFQFAQTRVENKGAKFAEGFDRQMATKGTMPLRFWDDVKKGMDDVIQNVKTNPSNTQWGTADSAREVRAELVRELDKLSKDPKTGRSVYADARDAFAGPAALKDMIEDGRKVFAMSESEIEKALFKASKSEVEAFRLGAADAWRDKIGTRGGISSVLAAPFERKTQMMLKSVFGDKEGFQRAMTMIENEGKMRALESVTGGSATARRLANQEDIAGSVIEAATAAKTGSFSGIARAGRSLAGRLGTPEVVRDEIGQMLLMQAGDKLRGKTRDEILTMIDEVAKSIAMGNSQAAAISGVLGGSIPLR